MADQEPTNGSPTKNRTPKEEAAALIAALALAEEAATAAHPNNPDVVSVFSGITEAYLCECCGRAAPASMMLEIEDELTCVWCINHPDFKGVA